MKKQFPGYYKQTEEEIKKIWKKAHLVFDTNILLNVYRFPDAYFSSLEKIIKAFEKKIWIPFIVAHEYNKNRDKVIKDSIDSYKQILDEIGLSKTVSKLSELYQNRHPTIKIEDLSTLLNDTETKIKEYLSESKKKHYDSNLILEKISNLFEGCIGEKMSESETELLREEAKKRYLNKIPPGYADLKSEPDKYNDYLIWKSVITYSKKIKSDIIFVTDDKKEDWWKISKKIPHPELINEFKDLTENNILIYSSKEFIELCKHYLNTAISDDEINTINKFITEPKIIYPLIKPIISRKYSISEERKINHMIEWFYSVYSDPADGVPYDSEEGGYQFHNGGPYDASEELFEKFPDMNEDLLEEAAERIFQDKGIIDWAKHEDY
ncbi:DUF4935 domain-containing protein [Leptospira sp. 201903074]|uniref:PIN domain-containing protein n=1 Tax=Leptospira abararensis TaxID=2810036 RepID=UPI001963002E|nr:PIN domain-containing protein [Leptospira abararensis]MBM9547410.1 DUF4935 domain-containing protein [Leptospira abararensis]